jgi:hypothetical protein
MSPRHTNHEEEYATEMMDLRRKLVSNYQEGENWIPKIVELDCDEVPSSVVSRLLSESISDGWVVRNPGRGMFIYESHPRLEEIIKKYR